MIVAGLFTCAYLHPTWTQVGSKLAQVEPMVAPSCLQLASSWTHVGPRSGSPAAPEPTQALPNPFHVATGPPEPLFVPHNIQHRPQKTTQTSNLDLQDPQLGAQKTSTWLQKTPFQAPNPAAQARGQRPGGWGVASLNIYIYIYIMFVLLSLVLLLLMLLLSLLLIVLINGRRLTI